MIDAAAPRACGLRESSACVRAAARDLLETVGAGIDADPLLTAEAGLRRGVAGVGAVYAAAAAAARTLKNDRDRGRIAATVPLVRRKEP